MPDDLESCSYSGPSNICLCPAASHVDNCFKNAFKEYMLSYVMQATSV